jgi:hypothetical protein
MIDFCEIVVPMKIGILVKFYCFMVTRFLRADILSGRKQKVLKKLIIIFHHEFRPGWPVSVSAVISSSSLLSGRPGHRLPFG